MEHTQCRIYVIISIKLLEADEMDITVNMADHILETDRFILRAWKKSELNDIYEYMTYLKDECKDSAVTRARKVASIKGFFKYLHVKAKIIDDNPAKELESPKLGKRLPKYLSLEQSTTLLDQVKNKKLTRSPAR